MKFVALSDTHCQLHKVIIPDGDVLLHCGDLTYSGSDHEIRNELDKLAKLNDRFAETIIIAGNHDRNAERNSEMMKLMCQERDIVYLNHEPYDLNGIKIFGSPWTPWFHDWAFNGSKEQLKRLWLQIPKDTNILLSHGPPYMVLDEVVKVDGTSYDPPQHVGCNELTEALKVLPNLTHHFFGHIHAHGGNMLEVNGIKHYNVSICGETYHTDNRPTEVEYEVNNSR